MTPITFGSTNKCCRQTALFLIAITESLLYSEVKAKRMHLESAHDVIVTIKRQAVKMGWILSITVVVAMIGGPIYNITYGSVGFMNDNTSRLIIQENEDMSVSVYEKLQNNTVKTAGYDSFRDFIDTNYLAFQNLDRDREMYQQRQLAVQMKQLSTTIQQLISTLEQTTNQFLSPLVTDAFATSVTIEDPTDLPNVHITFNATFANQTTAKLDQNITQRQADLLVTLLNGVVSQKIDPDKLQNLDLGMELPEEESEEQEIEEEGDNSGSGGGGGNDDGGNSPYDPNAPLPPGFGPEGPPMNPWPPTEEQPEPEPGDEGGGGGDEGGGSGDEAAAN